MRWNIAPECISVVILCIIWMYSLQSHSVPTVKNRIFQICFLTTFLAMTSNIVSTLCIEYDHVVPIWLNLLVTTVYFIMTPIMGVVYFSYALAILYEDRAKLPRWMPLLYLPAVIYLCLVLINLFNGCLFAISIPAGYVQGPYVMSTYIVFYIYCLACLVMVFLAGGYVEKNVRAILTVFPLIATVVVIVQQMFPYMMLSGTAATCALLIIYLNLQNKQIYNDYLLGIPNRPEFQRMIQLKLRKGRQEPFTSVVISLRNFKQVNDTYGSNCGDEFLKQISDYIGRQFKPNPWYRFSGDEFVVLIPGDDDAAVDDVTASFLERMEKPWHYGDYNCAVGAVAGIIKYPEIADSVQEIINAIECSVSWAKTGKEGNIYRCRQDRLEETKRRSRVIEIIKGAVETGRFEVYYQPMWSVRHKRFDMCESLLRLPDTPLGPLYPDEFIPLAEETGLIIPLTYQVLERVCRFVRSLLEKGVDIESITVNFSSVQFEEDNLVEKVLGIIEQNQTPFHKIKIEITESLLAERPERVGYFVEQMHRHGIQIGMDDFGTGYCNLASMLSFPVDVVKIDKSFLWSAFQNEKSAVMMRAIVQVVHELGMRVVSEGVESEEQRCFVEECGCEWIQGYLYAKPMPRDQAEELLRE